MPSTPSYRPVLGWLSGGEEVFSVKMSLMRLARIMLMQGVGVVLVELLAVAESIVFEIIDKMSG